MRSGYTAQFGGKNCTEGVFGVSQWDVLPHHLRDPDRHCVDVLLSLAIS